MQIKNDIFFVFSSKTNEKVIQYYICASVLSDTCFLVSGI